MFLFFFICEYYECIGLQYDEESCEDAGLPGYIKTTEIHGIHYPDCCKWRPNRTPTRIPVRTLVAKTNKNVNRVNKRLVLAIFVAHLYMTFF